MLPTPIVTQTISILTIIVIFNYSTTWISQSYDAIMTMNLLDEEKNPEFFDFLIVLKGIEKLGVIGLCITGLLIGKIAKSEKFDTNRNLNGLSSLPSREDYDEDIDIEGINVNSTRINTSVSSINTTEASLHSQLQSNRALTAFHEIIFGFLLYLSIVFFSYLQSSVNIIGTLVAKCFSLVLLYIIMNNPHQFSSDSENSKKKTYFSRISSFINIYVVASIGVVALSTVVKISINQIEGFFSGQLGPIMEEIWWTSIGMLCAMVTLDMALYSGIYWKKFIIEGDSNSIRQISSQIDQKIQSLIISPLSLLLSVTKYSALFFIIHTLLTSELFAFVDFTFSHPNVIHVLIKIICYHFLSQYILFYTISNYGFGIFLILTMTNGVWTKMGFYMVNSFGIHSIIFIGLSLSVGLMVMKEASDKCESKDSENIIN